jgi:ketosteroid isomerase-like protein
VSSAVSPADVVRRYHEALNSQDFSAIKTMLSTEAIYQSPGVGKIHGRSAILAAFRAYFAEYPDQVAEDSTIEVISTCEARARWSLTATMASTGAVIRRQGYEIVRVDTDGTILAVIVEDD